MGTDSEPRQGRVSAHGIDQVYFEWHPERRSAGSTLLLAHATGFHARCWDETIRRLGDRHHVIAVDLRGHGRTEKAPIESWRCFGEDLAGLIDVLDLESILGVGHSMGGHAMVDAAALRPEAFRGLLLFDPVIFAPERYQRGDAGRFDALSGGVHPIARRRNRFESPQAMVTRFADRPPYAHFQPAVLEDYCEFGLLPDDDAEPGEGRYVLACPPDVEASVYMSSATNRGIYESARALEIPVLIVRVKAPRGERELLDFSFSPTWPGLVKAFRRGREIHLSEASHFMPYEDPEKMAALILEQDAALAADSRS